jgi:hypothetical protein
MHFGQHGARDVEQRQQFVIPLVAVDVEEQAARGVADIRGMDGATGQLPQQPGVDGAEGEFATIGRALAPARLSSIQASLVAEK